MPQTKKDETPTTPRTHKPRQPKPATPPAAKDAAQAAPESRITEQPKCHIHDKVGNWEIKDIHESVCVNDEPFTKFRGKYYCLFHLPTKDKDDEKFKEKFRARLKAVDEKLAEIEELPEDERELSKLKISYDFRYVWFPSIFNLSLYKFSAVADFSSATFSAVAEFISTTFSADAYFIWATFSADAYFSKAIFSAVAYFGSATFSANADFSSVTFSADAYFRSATFSAYTFFTKTKFAKKGKADFTDATFEKDVYFDRTRFRNEVSFNSAIFGKDSDIIIRQAFFARNVDFQYCTAEGYVRFSNLRQGLENKFDFQEAAFEKATRVSFHTVDLCPGWFVNVDARKFVFTDIFWKRLDSDFRNSNIRAELKNLGARGIKGQQKRLFEIAARQLAVNAEENNRYDEAAKFRYMAMETRRLEELKKISASRYLSWLYKWTSSYGESWGRAAVVLVCLLFFFGAFYDTPLASFEPAEKKPSTLAASEPEKSAEQPPKPPEYYRMNNFEGFVHSPYVAALQRPDPKPADTRTRLFVILETIFAPLQAALLALAIRRKFMR